MARMNETQDKGGLLGTGLLAKKELPSPEDPVKMPDPFDPVRREVEKIGLRMARLRGGRLATILSPFLKDRIGTGRTAKPALTATTAATTPDD